MIDSFINHLKYEKRYSSNTVISYHNDIHQFMFYVKRQYEINDVKDINHFMIKSWLVTLKQSGIANTSINRKLSCLRKFFIFQKREGKIDVNPAMKIIGPKIGKRLPEVIRKNEMDQLLDEILVNTEFSEMRDRMIIEILYNTGIRRAELIGIKDNDIDLISKTIRILGKGNKQRIVPINDELISNIKKYINVKHSEFELNKSEFLLLTNSGNKLYPKFVYNIVHKYLSMVSTSGKRSPHILRHSIATHLSDENVEINALKELLGHSSLGSTQIYTHNSIEKLKKTYVKAHPKAK